MELVVVVGCAVLVGACASIVVARRRRAERVARRTVALAEVARRVDTAVSELEVIPAERVPSRPAVAHREPTGESRAAFVDAVTAAVAHARESGSRLALALVATEVALTPALADELRRISRAPVYVAGTRSAALVLPGLGRAGALGVLARIQFEHGLGGRAVELAADEDATELVARLLAPSAGE